MTELPEPDVLAESGEPLPAGEATTALPFSPGGQLRKAREARGFSVADVAQAIKFSARQIEAVERDDFDKLPGDTFLRGFVRSYAKLLNVDAQPLLASLDPRQSMAIPVQTPQEIVAALPRYSGRHIPENAKLLPVSITLATLGAVAVIAYLAWPGRSPVRLPSLLQSAHAPVAPAVVMVPDVQNASDMTAVAAAQMPAAASGAVAPAANSEHAPDAVLRPAALSVSESTASSAATAAPAAEAGTHRLSFAFAQKSWVEIKDASQRVIFAQNNDPGTRQVIMGKPPFALVVGNASAVRLEYDEKPVDLEPHTRVDVARLTLE